jgi:hypothetical protein
MIGKRKYLVKKVSDEGADVMVGAKKFDALLEKLIRSAPKTNADVVASLPKRNKGRGLV